MDDVTAFRNDLFTRICIALQLTDTQFKTAERAYETIGELLDADERLAKLHPRIYPQGSMALRTTVKPRGQVEYDLDMVLEVDGVEGMSPKWLYTVVKDCLEAHERYAKMLIPRPRCLRLEYANLFHLDIVPARSHIRLRPPFIEVPEAPSGDGQLHKWVTSNPRDFVKWFGQQCEKTSLTLLEKADQERLPQPVVAHQKPVLARAVQLFKRHRDVIFGSSPDAPSSIVLTTLAGTFYEGEAYVELTLLRVLDEIERFIARDPQLSSLRNPAGMEEGLCANWSQERCAKFATFVRNFRAQLLALTKIQGISNIAAKLRHLFGEDTLGKQEDVVSKAINEYVEEAINKPREAGTLSYVRSAGLSTVAGAGNAIAKNTFYGGKSEN